MYARRKGVAGLTWAAGVVVFAAGCASPGPSSPRFTGVSAARDQHVTVEIQNIGWADVTIYSATGGARMRLGTVNANQTLRFPLPKIHQWATDLRLIADPIGSSHTYDSEPVTAVPGQVVRWVVHESRGVRSLSVWGD